MATYGEIEDALGAVSGAGNDQVPLLRCASVYPAEPEIMNLRAMGALRDAFGLPVGLPTTREGSRRRGAQPRSAPSSSSRLHALRAGGPDDPSALEPTS